jgi:hypothetical protein
MDTVAIRKLLMETIVTAFVSAPDYETARAGVDAVFCSKTFDQLQAVDKQRVIEYAVGFEDGFAHCRGWKVLK